jgi:hypothetical protein
MNLVRESPHQIIADRIRKDHTKIRKIEKRKNLRGKSKRKCTDIEPKASARKQLRQITTRKQQHHLMREKRKRKKQEAESMSKSDPSKTHRYAQIQQKEGLKMTLDIKGFPN